jgi:hypothetical protein
MTGFLIPGQRYRSIGSKGAETVVLVEEAHPEMGFYITAGERQAAPVIKLGCERFWRPA